MEQKYAYLSDKKRLSEDGRILRKFLNCLICDIRETAEKDKCREMLENFYFMLTIKCFIIGILLSLSLQAKGIVYCPTAPVGAIIKRRELEEERRELEQREQLNNLLNELIKRGKTVEITADEDVKLLIKRRKMVDKNRNEKPSLTECMLGAIGIFMVCCLAFSFPIFIGRTFVRQDIQK